MGNPLFPGESGVDQLIEIIKILGTPSKEQIQAMNPNHTSFKFPQIKPHPWGKVFRNRAPPEAIDLISHLLVYDPTCRLTAFEVNRAFPFHCKLCFDKCLISFFNLVLRNFLARISNWADRHGILPMHSPQHSPCRLSSIHSSMNFETRTLSSRMENRRLSFLTSLKLVLALFPFQTIFFCNRDTLSVHTHLLFF